MATRYLPDEVIGSILGCLCVLPRNHWPVCKRWYKIGREVDRSIDEQEWKTQEAHFRKTYAERCRRRRVLMAEEAERIEDGANDTSSSRLAPMERELSTRLSEITNTNKWTLVEVSTLDADLRDIGRLLDAGATASGLSSYELSRPPNLGGLVDVLCQVLAYDSKTKNCRDSSRARKFHRLLVDLICSPCTSWRHHRRYVGNGGLPLPWFVVRFCIYGNPWRSKSLTRATPEDRWLGWKELRLMMLAAKTSGDLPELLRSTLRDGLVYYRNFESTFRSPVRMFFFRRVFSFVREDMAVSLKCLRESVFSEEYVNDTSHLPPGFSYGYVRFLLACGYTEDDIFDENVHRQQLSEYMLTLFWGSKFLQSYIYRLVKKSRSFRMGVLKYGTGALCRRKDRRMLELLVLMEPFEFIKNCLDEVIDALESTRGKKERLLSYMKALKESALQKDAALVELKGFKDR